MKQITEDYVSYETAKLLKEKGFDVPLYWYYDRDGILHNITYYCESHIEANFNHQNIKDEEMTSAPTQSIALKWLREEKGIYLDIFLDDDSETPWTYNIHKELRDGTTECVCHHHGNYYPLRIGYEEAVEAALKYSLENLI